MAICAGLSLGILVHRYAILPFAIDGLVPNALLWIAVGLLAGARAAYRAGLGTVTAGIVTPARLAVGLVAALAGAGAGFIIVPPLGFVPLRAREFPGFDLSVPPSAPAGPPPPSAGYRQGRFDVKRPAGMPGAISVRWSPGGLVDDEELGLVMGRLNGVSGPALEVEVAAPAELPTRSWRVGVGKDHLWTSQVVCGARRVEITTLATPRSAERLHRRVVGSFACHPDRAAERSVGDIPVIFDLGAGWSRVPSEKNELQLTDGKSVVLAHSILGHPSDEAIELLGKIMPTLHLGARDGDVWSITVDLDRRPHPGWLRLCDCDRDDQTLVLMWVATHPDPDRAGGRRILERTRCRNAGESPQAWPDLPPDPRFP